MAQQLCDEFEMLASPVIGVDMELKIEARLRHAHTLLAADQFSQVSHCLFRFLFLSSVCTQVMQRLSFWDFFFLQKGP